MVEEEPFSPTAGGADADDTGEAAASLGRGSRRRSDHLGPYRILKRVGAGGMGEVYRVHDPRLARDVAMKVLPSSLASMPGRLARFEREARALAALQHPNIVAIYSVEEIEDTNFFTMELVEGSSLAELLPSEGLGLARFFELAIPLTDAIGAAHRRGITHRDLKPANVMVDADDHLKVLDFGLTKLVPSDALEDTNAPTEPCGPTEIGQVVGTEPYMSPEQAKGLQVDHRSDIFSLGIVFYELLAGTRPFQGDTRAEVISSILRDDPPSLEERPQAVPTRLARVVERCLNKDRDRRYQSAIDVRNDLEELRQESESRILVGLPVRPVVSRGATASMVVSATVLAVASLIFWLDTSRGGSARGVVADTTTPAPVHPQSYEHRQITFDGTSSRPRISGNGDLVALESSGDPAAVPIIRILELRTDRTFEIGERQGLGTLRWSPDDRHLLLAWRNPEWVASIIPRFGGAEKPLDNVSPYAAWSPEGDRLVHASQASKGLRFLDLATLRDTSLPLDAEFEWVWDLDWSVETDRIAVLADIGQGKDGRIVMIVNPEQGVVSTSVSSKTLEHMRWGPAGKSLYFLSSQELVRSLLPDETEGELLLERVMPGVPVVSYSLSRDGTRIAYARPTVTANLWSLDLTSNGSSDPRRLTRGTLEDVHPALSPDGRRVAFTRRKGETAKVVVLDLETNELREVTALSGSHDIARWSPDGERLAFFSTHDGPRQLWSVSTQGGQARRIHDGSSVNGDLDWSPDGLRLAYVASDARTLVVVDASSGHVLSTSEAPVGWIFSPRFAPDGTRLAVHLHYGGGRHSLWTYLLGAEGEWQWGAGQEPPGGLARPHEATDLNEVSLLRWTASGDGLFLQQGNELYHARLSTGTLEPVASIPSARFSKADMSALGDLLVYSEAITSSDVWIAEGLAGGR